MAGFAFYGGLDLGKNEIQNVLYHKSATDPSSPIEGQFYYNTGSKKPRWYDGTAFQEVGSGGGTVTSFSAGDLSPLFTTTETNPSTTPALSFSLTNAAQNAAFIGPASGGAGAPSYRALVQADLPSSVPVSFWSAATANVSLGGFKITNLGTPTAGTDAVTKTYVDNLVQVGTRDYKESVRVASTANVSVTYTATGGASGRGQITAAPNTLNGVSLSANDRILLKDQSTGAQNGIWVVSTVGTGANGVWDRAADFDEDTEVTAGLQVVVTHFVTTDNRGTYVLQTVDPITIGGASGTALIFYQISTVGGYVAGNGMSATGFTFNIGATDTSMTIGADSIGVNLATNSGLEIVSGLKIKPDTTTANTLALTLTSNGAGVKYDSNSFTETSETLALAAGVAGAGLALTTGVLSVNVDNTTLEITTDSLNVKNAGITFAKIASGVWGSTIDTTGSVVNVSGYTVVSGATVCRSRAVAQTIATGAFSHSITHNLGTKDVQVFIRNTADDSLFLATIVATSTSAVTISGNNNTGATISASVIVQG